MLHSHKHLKISTYQTNQKNNVFNIFLEYTVTSHSKNSALENICSYFLFTDYCKHNMSVWKVAEVMKECMKTCKKKDDPKCCLLKGLIFHEWFILLKWFTQDKIAVIKKCYTDRGHFSSDFPFLSQIIKHYLANTTFSFAFKHVWVNYIFKKTLASSIFFQTAVLSLWSLSYWKPGNALFLK